MRREKAGVEARLEELAKVEYRPPDIDALVDTIMERLRDFPRVVAQGTPEERKSFVRTFVSEIRLHPHEARGTVRIKRIPLPPAAGSNGMSSLNVVAGARYEVEKNTAAQERQEIDHLLEVVFGPNGASLVPG